MTDQSTPISTRALIRRSGFASLFALAGIAAFALFSSSADAATPLPGGRPRYVTAMFGGDTTTSRWSIMRTLSFTAGSGSTGTVTAKSWAWYQATFTGDATVNKVATGYTTSGCTPSTGVVKTPLGYQPGQTGTTLNGTYTFNGSGQLVITWSSGKTDTWRFDNTSGLSYGSAIQMITCVGSNYSVRYAWGFGSQASLSSGATIAQIKAGGDLTFKNEVFSRYNDPDAFNSTGLVGLASLYSQCNSNMMKITDGDASGINCNGCWRSYIAGNPTTDGRKVYWNQQQCVVACVDAGINPCNEATCNFTTIGSLGGHTYAFMQVLDDNGVFRGFVGAEASLHTRAYGCAIVGASYWMQP
ncbi:MAG: hypothetical protein HZA31_07275 [Opitutae bacterium]|nr:hypothetical protein [Opitutae bacterium]